MRDRLKIPPTKSALLGLRRQVKFLEQGHAMLERKRELLTRLVYERLEQYRKLRAEVRDCITRFHSGIAGVDPTNHNDLMLSAGIAYRPGSRK